MTTTPTTRAIHISGYDRQEHDFYETPPWVTAALLRRVTLRPSVWEPCCGNGSIARVLTDIGHTVVATDLAERSYGQGGIDVYTCHQMPDGCASVITNPPYGDGGFKRSDHSPDPSAPAPAELLKFTSHLLNLAAPVRGQIALLVRLQWISGKRAAALLESSPLQSIIILTHRIQWFNTSADANRGQHNHVWLVFDYQKPPEQPPTIFFEGAVGYDDTRRCATCNKLLSVTAAPRTITCSPACRKSLKAGTPRLL